MKTFFKNLFARGANERNTQLTFRKNAPTAAQVNARQICFFAAFFLPVSKMLESPARLSKFAAGDLLAPAILHFLLQGAVIWAIAFLLSKLDKPLLSAIAERFGEWATRLFCFLYATYFLFSALLPLLDMEKFVYAAFYDTAPTNFTFAPFFLLCGYFCLKGLKALGRAADLSVFLFLIPFLAIILMSVGQTDFSAVLPVFGEPIRNVGNAFLKSAPHFSDAALFLPLFCGYRYKKGDAKKITLSYFGGALAVLLFLAVFFGLYTSLAPREHYAFIKIAQFFPALNVLGRIDLLFVYLLTVLLFFNACLPFLYSTELFTAGMDTNKRVLPSLILNVALFFFVLYCNRFYNAFYAFYERAFPVFWVFSILLPLCLFLLLLRKKRQNDGGRYALNGKNRKKINKKKEMKHA